MLCFESVKGSHYLHIGYILLLKADRRIDELRGETKRLNLFLLVSCTLSIKNSIILREFLVLVLNYSAVLTQILVLLTLSDHFVQFLFCQKFLALFQITNPQLLIEFIKPFYCSFILLYLRPI